MFGKIKNPKSTEEKPKSTFIQKNVEVHVPKTKPIAKKDNKNKDKGGKINRSNDDLKGSKFRILNEILYTNDSKTALEYFKNNQEDYSIYHQGYRLQAQKWDVKPVDLIIRQLSNNKYKNKEIVDLGCGDGQIQQNFKREGYHIQSYDLVSSKKFIKVADIANLPIKDKTKDVAIFCLSLMGTNYLDFIKQSQRILKQNGQLIIAEVQSRCKNWQNFHKMIESLGFKLQRQSKGKYFRKIKYQLIGQQQQLYINGKKQDIVQFSKTILQPCIYKKR